MRTLHPAVATEICTRFLLLGKLFRNRGPLITRVWRLIFLHILSLKRNVLSDASIFQSSPWLDDCNSLAGFRLCVLP